jgi:hypothetical protein
MDFAETRENKILEQFASNSSSADHQYSSLFSFISRGHAEQSLGRLSLIGGAGAGEGDRNLSRYFY